MNCIVFLVFLLVRDGLSTNPCCQGENRIIKKTCADGSPFSALACPSKYVTPRDSSMRIDEENNLVISESHIPPEEYCETQLDNREVYIVCFSEVHSQRNKVFIINAVLELISVLFLLLTIIIYLKVPDMLDLQGVCILQSISGLAISFLTLAANQLNTTTIPNNLCMFYAFTTYFAMLYAFFWLNILAFHIWRTISKPRWLTNWKHWSSIYHLFGIGCPVVLLVAIIIASAQERSDLHPGFGETKCWFKSSKSQFVYFYGPMAALLCLNVLYYAWTITVLWKNLNKCDEKKAKVLKYKLGLCVKLFFIMGILWVFEVVSAAFENNGPVLQYFWYVTDCLNTLQGVFIFCILVVFRKKVIKGMANRRILCVRLPNWFQNAADDECDPIEEEYNLSETIAHKS